MIFVTVGTHEQPFNRLIQKVDELKKDGVITEDVIIQTEYEDESMFSGIVRRTLDALIYVETVLEG